MLSRFRRYFSYTLEWGSGGLLLWNTYKTRQKKPYSDKGKEWEKGDWGQERRGGRNGLLRWKESRSMRDRIETSREKESDTGNKGQGEKNGEWERIWLWHHQHSMRKLTKSIYWCLEGNKLSSLMHSNQQLWGLNDWPWPMQSQSKSLKGVIN